MYKIYKVNNKALGFMNVTLLRSNFITFINPSASVGAFKHFIHLINAWKNMKHTKK